MHPIKYVKSIVNQKLHDRGKSKNKLLNNETAKKVQIKLSYNGKQGKKPLSKMKKHLNKLLPNDVKRIVIYENRKVETKFRQKDKTKFNETILFTTANVCIKHTQKITLVIQIRRLN